jgi:prepilin-type N-terminal cleavage/methylation domain-containing protein
VNARGLTLLEAIVALVILGLVVTAYLGIFATSARTAADATTWSQAVVYAEDAMESAKLGLRGPSPITEQLGRGFERRTEIHPWNRGLARITVVVQLPRGERFELDRLVRTR